MKFDNTQLVGIAIASFNRKKLLRECLDSINKSDYKRVLTCVVDDGSSDDTWDMLNSKFPTVEAIKGDGSLWWGGATNKAIERCVNLGCEYVILLNDDCILQEDTITKFVELSADFPESVIAPVTIDIHHPDRVWWAGSTWGPVNFFPFIWLIRQKYPHNYPATSLPDSPYATDEFTGRATFVPKGVFESVGLIDAKTFPQYGADNDFSLRVAKSKHGAIVDPNNRVLLYTQEAGQNTSGRFWSLPVRFFKLMFFRKHGEVARFWWYVLKRHAPWYAVIPSYLFILILTFLRVFKILPVLHRIFNRRDA